MRIGRTPKYAYKFKARKPRRRRLARVLRQFSGLIAIVVLAGGFQLHQNGTLLSVFGNDFPTVFQPSSAKTITGRASVIDGDTIRIKGEKVRLHGIDAPETSQTCISNSGARKPCGREAARYLKRFLRNNATVECKFISRDKYGRILGDCYRRDGKSLAVAMVSAGHALDWPRYSRRAYSSYQNRARAEKRGLWAYRFERPWDFRSKRRSG